MVNGISVENSRKEVFLQVILGLKKSDKKIKMVLRRNDVGWKLCKRATGVARGKQEVSYLERISDCG